MKIILSEMQIALINHTLTAVDQVKENLNMTGIALSSININEELHQQINLCRLAFNGTNIHSTVV